MTTEKDLYYSKVEWESKNFPNLTKKKRQVKASSLEDFLLRINEHFKTSQVLQTDEKDLNIIDNLFVHINNESLIHVIEHDDPDEPGYVWQWGSATESNEVFETQELALINAINFLSNRASESMIALTKAKEETMQNENNADKYLETMGVIHDELATVNMRLWLVICFFFGVTGGLTKWIFDLLH